MKNFALTVAARIGVSGINLDLGEFRKTVEQVITDNPDAHDQWKQSDMNWRNTLTSLIGQFVCVPKAGDGKFVESTGDVNYQALIEDCIPKALRQ